ncbi:MAG: AAA family ATPase, partial [Solirubrobacterales bacterium]|nr:AAA family ATPase [Solirubrobacterales bacterium]
MAEAAVSTSSVPLPGPLSSARDRPWPIVGRDGELSALASAWERIAAGGRETVLIAGDPGAGKSRLVAEAGATAHAAGGLVLYGSGEETAGAPYAPFVAALAHLARHAAPGPPLEELRASPLGRLLPGGDVAGGPADWGLGDDRGRLFAATVEQLERQAEHRPLMLVVDDLHGCGMSTLLLVEHLARTDAALRLLLVATYRPTDLDPDDERAGLIAGLRSAPGAQHIELGALDAPALRDIAASLGVADEPAALDAIAASAERESAGNALFACELLRAAGEGAGADTPTKAPRSLRMLIGARAHALGRDAHEHLSAAAVCGRTFDARTVADAFGADPAALAESAGRAEHAGLVAELPDGGGWTFTHAIVARCLYEELHPVTRGRLHRRLAETLEAAGAGESADRAGELALHWRRADPPDDGRAARYCAVAGAAALDRYDHGVAAGWFEQALELRDRGGGAPDAGRCDLLIGLGKALRFADQERSREVLLEASRLADALDDVDRLVE